MKRAAAIAAIALAVAAVVVWGVRRAPSPAVMETSSQQDGSEAVAPPSPPLPSASPSLATEPTIPKAPSAPREEPKTLGEPALMALLREIGGTAPERSIALARAGQRRFPNSADAPERAFIIVQSLVNLRRFHEARDEAKEMVRRYPDNTFALDAQRHLLVYPLDQPSREEMQRAQQGLDQ